MYPYTQYTCSIININYYTYYTKIIIRWLFNIITTVVKKIILTITKTKQNKAKQTKTLSTIIYNHIINCFIYFFLPFLFLLIFFPFLFVSNWLNYEWWNEFLGWYFNWNKTEQKIWVVIVEVMKYYYYYWKNLFKNLKI